MNGKKLLEYLQSLPEDKLERPLMVYNGYSGQVTNISTPYLEDAGIDGDLGDYPDCVMVQI